MDEYLKEGEIICPKCDGRGTHISYIGDPRDLKVLPIICPKCRGAGKLDWVENVVGKKKDFIGESIFYLFSAAPSKVWYVSHNFGTTGVIVTIIDLNGNHVSPSFIERYENECWIYFDEPQSGRAFVRGFRK